MVRGHVKEWDATTGSGLVSCPDLPADVRVDAGALRGRAGDLRVGDEVLLDYEPAGEGRAFRARWLRTRPVPAL
jgi:cold shock CspA family protein